MSQWTEGKLGEICDIEIGGTPSRSEHEYWDTSNETENHWVSIRDMNQRIVQYTSERISDLGVRNSNAKRVDKGSILLSFKLSIGKVGIAGLDLYTNKAIAALKPRKINPDYLYYGLQYWDLLQDVDAAIKGATLNKEKLHRIRVNYPSDPVEQARIAQILSTVDVAIEQTETLIAKYGRIRTGLMQDLLTQGIDEQTKRPLGQLADVSSGITLGKKHEGPDIVEKPYLRVANVQDGFLDLSEITYIKIPARQVERYELQAGDVLMNEGGDFDKLGRGTVWQDEIPGCLHQNHVFRVRCNRELLLPEYLALLSTSSYGKRFFILNSKQSTNLASINSTQLKSFPIPLPSLDEQKRLIDIFAKKTAVLDAYKEHLSKLQILKRGMMQDLLSAPQDIV